MNNAGLPGTYSWTASNGNKFTNLIEVLEGQTIVEAGYDMNAIGSSLRGNYTWKNQWYEASNGSGNAIVYESYVPNGNDITIYGKWVSTITYNNNGAGATTANKEVLKGQAISSVSGLPALTSAYTFKGWCATNPTSASHATISGTWVPTGNTTIYAKWVSVITYNNNGAGNAVGNKEVLKGQTLAQAGAYPTLSSNYTFKGWSTSNPTSNSYSTLMTSWIPTGNRTLYAVWVSIVIFNLAQNSDDYTNTGWRPQAPVEVVKGQAIQGIDAYPENGDYWYYWYDSYENNGGYLKGSGNKIMSWNGWFTPTGGTINLYPARY